MTQLPRRRLALALALATLLGGAHPIAAAQAWPGKGPIRLVAVFPPGGSVDQVARILAPVLQQQLQQTVVVENKGGASGAIGTGEVARAAPDGSTFGVVFDTHGVNPALQPRIGFDTRRDLTTVALVGTSPMVISAHVDQPYKTFADVATAAKAAGKGIGYGTIGNGSLGHLAVTTAQRNATLPAVPTLAEQGFRNFDAPAWWDVIAPARMPAELVQRMNAEINKALQNPEVAAKLAQQGIVVNVGTPAQAQAFVEAQLELWDKVVKDNGIKAD